MILTAVGSCFIEIKRIFNDSKNRWILESQIGNQLGEQQPAILVQNGNTQVIASKFGVHILFIDSFEKCSNCYLVQVVRMKPTIAEKQPYMKKITVLFRQDNAERGGWKHWEK